MSLLPALERELIAAESRLFAAHRAGGRISFLAGSRGRPRPGAIVVAVGVAVALAVAVIVVAVSGRAVPHTAPLSPARESVSNSRQELLRILGVLRAPATATDLKAITCASAPATPRSLALPECRSLLDRSLLWPRLAPSPARYSNGNPGARQRLPGVGSPRLDRTLIRVVSIPKVSASIALLPQTWQPSRHSRRRTEGIVLAVALGRSVTTTGPSPSSVATLRARGLATTAGNATPQMHSVIDVIVVPDGVASVTLRPIRLIAPPAPINPRRFGTVTTSIHNNVGAFRFNVPTARNPHTPSGVKYVHVLMRETWSDPHGKIIARTTTRIPLWLRVHGIGPINSTN